MIPTARIGAAPISWGVCEVPGWGYQAEYDFVLSEMVALGVTQIELGPDGFLPSDTDELKTVLDKYSLNVIGGFVPTVLFDANYDPLPELLERSKHYSGLGAKSLILSADSGETNYDNKKVLTDAEWETLYQNIGRIVAAFADSGVNLVLHPHVGTVIETAEEVLRVLENTTVNLCVDTGHLLIGGTDPVELAENFPTRVGHVHLKDVNKEVLARVKSGELAYTEGVANGLYTVLGEGDVEISRMVQALESNGYQGLYVIEQDVIVNQQELSAGVAITNTRNSIKYLSEIETGR